MLIYDPTLQPFEISIENVSANRSAQEILFRHVLEQQPILARGSGGDEDQ